MEYRMGIDVGTTNIKAAVFDESCKMAAFCQLPTPIVHPKDTMSEFEPEAMWKTVCDCLRGAVGKVGAGNVAAVGVSSMAEAGVPLDADGKPLYNFIAWYDMRSRTQCESLVSEFGKDRIYLATGQTASAKYGITKLMWIKDECPDVFKKTKHWLSMEDYILYRLTGRFATDYSAASRTMAFDIRSLDWNAEIISSAGVDVNLFPKAYPGGSRVGGVTPDASKECGLAAGTSVATGGHDHACAAIAVDILRDRVVLDSIGTGEVSMVAMSEPNITMESLGAYYSVYPHCGRKMYRALTSNQSCGLTIEWFLKTFCPDIIGNEKTRGISRYDGLFGEMSVDPNRHEGLFFLPMIRGTVEQTGMYGGFCGITDIHNRGDFIAAMIDGMLYEVKRQVNGYQNVFGERYDVIRAVGGASESQSMMSRKADVHNSVVQTPDIAQAACMGAAILGAVGAGKMTFDDIGALYVPGREYTPNAVRAENDFKRFNDYERLRKCAMAANAAWMEGR